MRQKAETGHQTHKDTKEKEALQFVGKRQLECHMKYYLKNKLNKLFHWPSEICQKIRLKTKKSNWQLNGHKDTDKTALWRASKQSVWDT